MDIGSFRDTWIEINLDAIEANVKAFKNHIHSTCRLMAVVKADGYGHGSVEVAKAAIEAGADYLAAAFLDEALILRENCIKAPILILGYTGLRSPRAIEYAIEQDITLTVFSKDVAEQIVTKAETMKRTAYVHIKVDSGMNRIGLRDKEKIYELIQLLQSDYVVIEGIFTHFADADNQDASYTVHQFKHFQTVIQYLEEKGIDIPIKHCCNSAAAIAYPEMHMDMVRVGVSLYGLNPSEHLKKKIELKQAMSLKTKPVMIKSVDAGHPISYGCTYIPDRTAAIATLPLGYADGFSRSLSNKGHAVVNGKKAPIVGRVCMDQTMVDVTEIEDIEENDVFILFGDPDEGNISLAEVAEQMNTIHYETACLMGKRVPRLYKKNGNTVQSKGLLTL